MSHRSPRVSVIVVTYNSEDTIDACLNSLNQNVGVPQEVIIIDNCSNDSTVTHLKDRFDNRLVCLNSNLGFSKACNRGAAIAEGEYLLMLNPDTVVLGAAIDTAVGYLDGHPGVGAVGATTLHGDGSINPTCCFAQPTLWGTFSRAIGLSTAFQNSTFFNPEQIGGWDRQSTREVGAITGCFFMVGRELFERLGGFDERFFMYSEDTDLSLRIQRSGRSCVHLAGARVIHHGGRSDSEPALKMVKVLTARATFFRKHWWRPKALLGIRLIDLTVGLRALATSTRARFFATQSTSKWLDVWQRRPEWRVRDPI